MGRTPTYRGEAEPPRGQVTCPGSGEVAVGFHAWVTSQGPTWLGRAAKHRRTFQGQRPQFIGEETESSSAYD